MSWSGLKLFSHFFFNYAAAAALLGFLGSRRKTAGPTKQDVIKLVLVQLK